MFPIKNLRGGGGRCDECLRSAAQTLDPGLERLDGQTGYGGASAGEFHSNSDAAADHVGPKTHKDAAMARSMNRSEKLPQRPDVSM